jgi:hypothetical protein
METTTGMVTGTEVWTNLVLTAIGIILLFKADWKVLLPKEGGVSNRWLEKKGVDL